MISSVISRLRFPTLLPALRMLNFSAADNDSLKNIDSVLLTISPTLSTVRIGPVQQPESEVILASFFQALSPKPLQRLFLKGHLTNISLRAIPRFSKLESLYLGIQSAPQVDLLGICSMIQTLRVLSIAMDHEVIYQKYPTSVRFSSLQLLYMRGPVLATTSIFCQLQESHVPRLTAVITSVTGSSAIVVDQVTEMLQVVEPCVRIGQASRLAYLSLSLVNLSVMWGDIRPLRRLENLNILRIDASGLSITDRDVDQFFGQCHLPELTSLTILCRKSIEVDAFLSPVSLGILSRHCLKLTSLTIAIRFKADNMSLAFLENEMANTPSPRGLLKMLRLRLVYKVLDQQASERQGYTVISAAVISRLINYCFPYLEDFKMDDPIMQSRAEEVDWFRGVEQMVRSYREARGRTPSSRPPSLHTMSPSKVTPTPGQDGSPASAITLMHPTVPSPVYHGVQHPLALDRSANASTTESSLSDRKSEVTLEKGSPSWEGYLDDDLPEKTHGHFLRNVRFQIFSLYRRLFGVVFITNMAIFIAMCVQGADALYLGKIAIANIFVAILMRQDYVINAFFLVACAAPRS